MNESDSTSSPSYPPCMKTLCPDKIVLACQLRGLGAMPVMAGLENSICAVKSDRNEWKNHGNGTKSQPLRSQWSGPMKK